MEEGKMDYLCQAFLDKKTQEVVVPRGIKFCPFSQKFIPNPQTNKLKVFTSCVNIYNDLILAIHDVFPEIAYAIKLGFRVKKIIRIILLLMRDIR